MELNFFVTTSFIQVVLKRRHTEYNRLHRSDYEGNSAHLSGKVRFRYQSVESVSLPFITTLSLCHDNVCNGWEMGLLLVFGAIFGSYSR